MNDIDLTKILKDCPKGTKLYSTIFGEVEFVRISGENSHPVILKAEDESVINVDSEGKHFSMYEGECTLFPSREQRDWGKFTAPWLEKQDDSLRVNDRAWLYLVSDVLTWKDGVGQYLDNPRVQELAKRLCSEYSQKLYNLSVLYNSSNTEKKSADKIEPKFKVGDWVVHKFGDLWHIDSLGKKAYQVSYGKGNYNYFPISKQDEMHLWTIREAKDGDILATSAGAFIYNGNNGGGSCPGSYCGINTLGNFQTGVEHHWTGKKVYPATKEQRYVLMKAMNDAGYEWNAKKKELKKLVKVPGKFDPKTLKPFDKIIACSHRDSTWNCALFSFIDKGTNLIRCCGACYRYCVPYNDDTKHLVGTTKEAPEFYRYWEN